MRLRGLFCRKSSASEEAADNLRESRGRPSPGILDTLRALLLVVIACAGCGRVGFEFGFPIVPCEDVTASATMMLDDTCYTRHDTPGPHYGTLSCPSLGGRPIYIDTAEKNAAIQRFIDQPTWIGLGAQNGAWYWDVGTAVLYENWAPGEPVMTPDCNSHGAVMNLDGTWHAECSYAAHPIMCAIDAWAVDPASNHGYRFTWPQQSWNLTEAYCEMFGSHLVTLTSEAEREFLLAHAGTYYWIGGTNGGAGPFGWVTGEPFDAFTLWAMNQPGTGSCIRTDYAHQWVAEDCGAAIHGWCELEPP